MKLDKLQKLVRNDNGQLVILSCFSDRAFTCGHSEDYKLVKRIERIDDGEILELNNDGKTYSFIKSEMASPHKYTLERLMEDPRAKGKFRII